jgi:hypothetical protein
LFAKRLLEVDLWHLALTVHEVKFTNHSSRKGSTKLGEMKEESSIAAESCAAVPLNCSYPSYNAERHLLGFGDEAENRQCPPDPHEYSGEEPSFSQGP